MSQLKDTTVELGPIFEEWMAESKKEPTVKSETATASAGATAAGLNGTAADMLAAATIFQRQTTPSNSSTRVAQHLKWHTVGNTAAKPSSTKANSSNSSDSSLQAALARWTSTPSKVTYWPMTSTPLRTSDKICVQSIPAASGKTCKFMSQVLCNGTTEGMENLTGGHAECMARKSSCALVGSSVNLLFARKGKEIDDHDRVIRINGAPAGDARNPKFAPHVGRRTTVRFVNEYGHAPSWENKWGMCTFMHEPKVGCGHLCWRDPDRCDRTCNVTQKLKCLGEGMDNEKDWGNHNVFLDHVHSGVAQAILNTPRVTAGFKALSYALHSCDTISIYGFGPSCSGEVGVRYYKEEIEPMLWHNYKDELELLKEVTKIGLKAFPRKVRGWVVARNISLHLPRCLAPDGKANSESTKPAGNKTSADQKTVAQGSAAGHRVMKAFAGPLSSAESPTWNLMRGTANDASSQEDFIPREGIMQQPQEVEEGEEPFKIVTVLD